MAAPYAPTLTGPANGASVDVSTQPAFSWTFNPATGTGPANQWAFRMKVAGGSYQYWNQAGNAWSPTVVWNAPYAGATGSGSVFWSQFANGNVYNWSAATGDAISQGPFAADFTLYAQATPSLVITAPLGTISNQIPTITWTPGSGFVNGGFNVVVYTQAQTVAAGFVAGTTAGVAGSSGPVYNPGQTSFPLSSPLPNGNYVVYVQVYSGSGSWHWTSTGYASPWTSQSFTVSANTPVAPSLTATPSVDGTTGAPYIALSAVVPAVNMLTGDDADFESSIGTWVAGSNTTVSRSSLASYHGTYAMLMQASANGTISASTNSGVDYLVIAGSTYSAQARTSGGATFTIGIQWYNTAGGLISTTTGSGVSGAWALTEVTNAVAPSTAAYARLIITGSSAVTSTSYFADVVGLHNGGTPPAWAPGVGSGQGVQTLSFNYSDDGGNTWQPLRSGTAIYVPAAGGTITASDYEVHQGSTREYQAITTAIAGLTPVASTYPVASPAATASASIPVQSEWWLIDPLDPTQTIALTVVGFTNALHEQLATHYPLGSQFPVVVADVVNGQDGSIQVETLGQAAYQAVVAVASSQRIKWLTSPHGDGYYVRLGAASPTLGISGMNTQQQLNPSPADNAYRQITLQFVQTAMPVGVSTSAVVSSGGSAVYGTVTGQTAVLPVIPAAGVSAGSTSVAPSLVQVTAPGIIGNNATTATVTLQAAATAGNLLVARATIAPMGAAVAGPSGFTQGGYNGGVSPAGGAAFWYKQAAGGEMSFTFTMSASGGNYTCVEVAEFTDVPNPATVDGTPVFASGGYGTQTETLTYGSNPAVSGELTIGFYGTWYATSDVSPAGWTKIDGPSNTNANSAFYYTAAGAVAPTFAPDVPSNSGAMIACLAVFKAGSPPSASPPGAPTGVTATGGDTTATVSWTAPSSNGGAPITSYTVDAATTITQAGGPWDTNGSSPGPSTLAITTHAVGNLVWVATDSHTVTPTALSSGKVTWDASPIDHIIDSVAPRNLYLWKGVVTAVGTDTITVTWSGSTSSVYTEIMAMELGSSVPGTLTWSVVAHNTLAVDTNAPSLEFPSLTSGASTVGAQVYVGFGSASDDSGGTVTPSSFSKQRW